MLVGHGRRAHAVWESVGYLLHQGVLLRQLRYAVSPVTAVEVGGGGGGAVHVGSPVGRR